MVRPSPFRWQFLQRDPFVPLPVLQPRQLGRKLPGQRLVLAFEERRALVLGRPARQAGRSAGWQGPAQGLREPVWQRRAQDPALER